ncbi:hypothetical protein [Variovorax sp. J31P179]|uniref:hypothetical protein n=1 Tax=Variovorax sp. J31P179 TaxID=3053508 RepID=UPI0025764CCD|nr:hypothetical protein [Variovorax sp. J31P179]
MKPHPRLLICVATAMAGQGAAAVSLQPSDLELTAVYCAGVLQNRLRLTSSRSPGKRERRTAQRPGAPGGLHPTRLPTLDATRLAIARRRANDDFMTWHADAEACRLKCAGDGERAGSEKRRSCRSECSRTGATFERMRICSTIDWLPP